MRAFGDSSIKHASLGGRIFGLTGAVASEHYLSAQAGMDMLREGGNAFDAAAAAAFTESLVNPHMFTLGGECPILAKPAGGEPVCVNGNVMAPARASLDNYLALGLEMVPARGILAAGAPAAPGAILAMLERFGSLPLSVVAEPARKLAAEGFPVHEGLAGMPNYGLADVEPLFAKNWPASAALYLDGHGHAPAAGSAIKNRDYANLLEEMARAAKKAGDGPAGMRAASDFFYKGEPASLIARFSRERGGFLEREDMEAFFTKIETPCSILFRGARVYKCGPWSQGPVFLQILRILNQFDLSSLDPAGAPYAHLWLEAAKLAFADREQYYADPDKTPSPLAALLSEEYAALRAGLIDPARASLELRPGDPVRGNALLPRQEIAALSGWGHGTVHVAAADKWGNLAALTPSGGWISGNEIVAGLGIALTTRLQTFYLDSRHPNAPAPGKRPRTTLSPSMAIVPGGDGKPGFEMAFGTMGGDQQDQWTSQFFLNMLLFGMTAQEAIEAPKITSDHFPNTFYPHESFPGRAKLEGRIAPEVANELSRLGHEILVQGPWSAGFICAALRHENGTLEAACDPRGSAARAFPAAALAR